MLQYYIFVPHATLAAPFQNPACRKLNTPKLRNKIPPWAKLNQAVLLQALRGDGTSQIRERESKRLAVMASLMKITLIAGPKIS
ncbi:MAG: hypothetical protein RLZZ427_1599 [Pseudomonadota bacterium]|jgi:hypothetical protein